MTDRQKIVETLATSISDKVGSVSIVEPREIAAFFVNEMIKTTQLNWAHSVFHAFLVEKISETFLVISEKNLNLFFQRLFQLPF